MEAFTLELEVHVVLAALFSLYNLSDIAYEIEDNDMEMSLVHVNAERNCLCGVPSLDLALKTYKKNAVEYLVGRNPSCDLHLDAEDLPFFLSRQHAKVTVRGRDVSVTDLQSLNGTFVNNVMIAPNTETSLAIGDSVTFGCVAPNTTIAPGSVVVQEKPRFKFVLKECSPKSRLTLAHSPKPICASTPQSSVREKEDEDSGIICSTSASAEDSLCATPLKHQTKQSRSMQQPKQISETFDELENSEPASHTAKNSTLPLTVSNLIAYSGCKFQSTNIDLSCDEKENQLSRNITCEKRTLNKHPCTSQSRTAGHATRPQKRRRGQNFSAKKSRKTSGMEACSHFECGIKKRHKSWPNTVVSWVQCDSCDKWFHTECVGCDYDKVKLTSQKFHCGLC